MTVLFTLTVLGSWLITADEPKPTREERLLQEWKQMLPKELACKELYWWVYNINPRPTQAFTPFTEERVVQDILNKSTIWCDKFFQPVVNPASRRKSAREPHLIQVFEAEGPAFDREGKPLPRETPKSILIKNPKAEESSPVWVDAFRNTGVEGGYYLPTVPEHRALLLFRWKGNGYKFEMQESTSAVLLRIQLDASLKELKEGFSRERIETVLKKVLSQTILDQGPLTQQFQIPERLPSGTVLSNAEKEAFRFPIISDWKSNVLIFVHEESVGIILFKAKPHRQHAELGDYDGNDRFLTSIYQKDGKTVVQPKK